MRTRFFVTSLAAVVSLAGCSAAVPLQPAALANDPACAAFMVQLPDSIGTLERRSTNAQSTAAWGQPAAVIARCGLDDLGPSALPCFTVDGVDWLRDDSHDPSFVFTTFGRTPGIEVTIDSTLTSGTEVLDALSNAVGQLSPSAECLGAEDVFGG
jgi:hypothetical protein